MVARRGAAISSLDMSLRMHDAEDSGVSWCEGLGTADRKSGRGEHGQCFGGTEKIQAALGASKALAVERVVRIAVGFLAANVTWH